MHLLLRGITVFAILAVGVLAGPAPAAQANTISAPFETHFATKYVSAGVGSLRNFGAGTIILSGVTGTVTKAYLYWHGPTNSSDPTANAAVSLNGNAVTGTNIGFSSDNCWGFQNSQAYRADVTSLVAGNGAYAVSGMVKAGGSINVNGASLIVFFDDGNPANNRDVVIFNGNDSNIPNPFDAPGWNVSLPGINYTGGTANLQLHVSDGQTFADAAVVVNGTTIAGPGAVFQGDTVPGIPAQPNGPTNNGRLWDIKNFDVTAQLIPGTNPKTLTMTTGVLSDCLSLVVALVDLPAGAAPTREQQITAQGTAFTSAEGAVFTGAVATFNDPATTATAAEYVAAINWGDGSPSAPATIGGSGGNFTVSGTHTYAEERIYTVKVTITDTDTPSNFAVASSTLTVGDAALTATGACSATTPLAYHGPTATFADAASPFGTLSDFSATINWGDATTSAGTVSGPNGGPYIVSGSHTYATTGTFAITTSIKDVGSSTATATCNALAFQFAPGGGSFAIGNQNSAIGTSVEFWGAKWANLNSLTGGPAPDSFKGFAESPATPACGTNWSADPGNSTPPPTGSLPAYMGVIVTDSASKSGSTVSGDTVRIVVVKTDPGYQPNPGHAGTGTVVATFCVSN